MIGNILAPFEGIYIEPPFDPDNMFDPITHIATEENFIKLLENNVYDSKYIGYKVQLSNTVGYNDGLLIIADINHDSENTGQTNCYDLISENCVGGPSKFGSGNYRYSTLRSYLVNTFYPGFSTELKAHTLDMKYLYDRNSLTTEKIIVPSTYEAGFTATYAYALGKKYSAVFSNNASRIKTYNGTAVDLLARNLYTYDNQDILYFTSSGDGSYGGGYYTPQHYIIAIIRVQ